VIYNGVSPNGDGKNDFWLIEFIDLLDNTKNNEVRIFNRWGDLVWEAKNYDNQTVVFTGLNRNGKELPSGNYFYQVNFSGRSSESGYISLRR
jgi:gliding motility-associated-like protein